MTSVDVMRLSEAGDRYYKAVQEAVGGDLQAPNMRYYPVTVETRAYDFADSANARHACEEYAYACFDARWPLADDGKPYVARCEVVDLGEFPPLIPEGIRVLLVIERAGD